MPPGPIVGLMVYSCYSDNNNKKKIILNNNNTLIEASDGASLFLSLINKRKQ